MNSSIGINTFRELKVKNGRNGGKTSGLLKFILDNESKAFDITYLAQKFDISPNTVKAKATDWRRKGLHFGIRSLNGNKYIGLVENHSIPIEEVKEYWQGIDKKILIGGDKI